MLEIVICDLCFGTGRRVFVNPNTLTAISTGFACPGCGGTGCLKRVRK